MELIISSYGISLSRDTEGFVISKDSERQRIPVESISSIQISKGASITSDAIMLAIEHKIEIMFMDKSGSPLGRIWSSKYGSISTIRKGQVNFTFSEDAVEWIKQIIQTKIQNQQAILLIMECKSEEARAAVSKSVQRLEDYHNKISKITGKTVSDIAPTLRGWEGISSKIYFETINLFIPEEYRFSQRSQHPATDIVNATLNYGYGILYGKIEGALIKSGIDPYIGVMHRDDYNRPVLVYDIIELYRYWVEYIVFSLVSQNIITDEFYSIRSDGSYWLENLGRRIVIQSINDYLEEIIEVKELRRTRLTQIQLYAQELAQKFKTYE